MEMGLKSVPRNQTGLSLMSPYIVRTMHPGCTILLEEGARYLKALQHAQNNKDTKPTIKFLVELNHILTRDMEPLETHDPTESPAGFKTEDKTYYYPDCPRGFPLEDLPDFFFFGEDKVTGDLLKSARRAHGSWYKVMQGPPVVENADGAAFNGECHPRLNDIFQEETYSAKKFITAWTTLQNNTSTDPVQMAAEYHWCIVTHTPFKVYNRVLARIVMHWALLKEGVYPPLFLSRPDYELTCYDRDAFIQLMCWHSAEAAAISTGNINVLMDGIYEWHDDNAPVDVSLAAFCEFHSRVLFSDLERCLIPFLPPSKKVPITAHQLGMTAESGTWVHQGLESTVADSLARCVANGILRVIPATASEYDAQLKLPDFTQEMPFSKWQPSAIVYVNS